MVDRSRFMVALGRLLAAVVALAMGSALAVAQVPAPPAPEPSSKDKDAASNESLSKEVPSRPASKDKDPASTESQEKDKAPSKEKDVAPDPRPDRKQAEDRSQDPASSKAPTSSDQKKQKDRPATGRTRVDRADDQNRNRDGQAERRSEDPIGDADVRRQPNLRGEGDARAGQARKRAGLGIQFGAQEQGSLTIGNIEAESGAARAGFRAGDRIVSVDGRTFTSPRQFQAYLSGQFGRPIPVIIDRGGQRYSIQLPASQPSGDGPWLGVYLQDNEENQTGARVTNIYPSGPAARAGLRNGDVVLQVNGQAIASTPDLIATIDEFEPQSRVEFLVQRGDQQLTIPVLLGSRESFIFHRQENEGERNENYDDEFGNVPPHAMQLEHDRRMAEQHQRIETELRKLQDEVRQLRELLEQKK